MTTPTGRKRAAKTGSAPSKSGRGADDTSPDLQTSDTVGTAIIAGFTFGQRGLQYAVVDGRAIFEGDIDLGSVEEVEAANAAMRGEGIAESVVITGSRFRWPGGRVPYEIDPAMPSPQRVTDAIAHWEAKTAIRFTLRTPANANSFPNYVRFFHGSGCSSQVGMRGGRQDISLGTGCDVGRAVHEIGHAVGLWHEQSREDRDSFVTIHWGNIQQGKEHNFNQHISDGDDVGPYDYGSIMHYPRNAFGINGAETITPINPASAQIGQRVALSAGDIAAAAGMYGSPPVLPVKKLLDDRPPVGIFKKNRDDPPLIKKIRDDRPIPFPPLRPQPPIGVGAGVAPFLLATGHHADVDETTAAVGAEVEAASAAVDEARRNVVALQTALTSATGELARAQERLEAIGSLVAGLQ